MIVACMVLLGSVILGLVVTEVIVEATMIVVDSFRE